MVKTQFLYLCLSVCLFWCLITTHEPLDQFESNFYLENSVEPREFSWLGFKTLSHERIDFFLGKTTGKAGYVILIKEDYTILNIYTQERKRKSKELSFYHKIKFKNSKALYYVWMQRYGNMKFFFCCKNSVPLLYFHRHCNNYFSYQ